MAAEEFVIRVDDSQDPAVVMPTGELDVYTAPTLRMTFVELVEAEPGRHLVLDMSGLSFVDSSGLGVLVAGLKRLRSGGGDLSLRGPNRQVFRVIEMTGLDKVFTIEELPN